MNIQLIFTLASALIILASTEVSASPHESFEKELQEANEFDPVKESARSAERIKRARQELALAQKNAQLAKRQQQARYQRQLQADKKADLEIAKIQAETQKYKKDLAIAEFNQRRSEIALAYSKAKVAREKNNKTKVYQRKIAAERAVKAGRN